jgi:uncharacterized membrane protein YphA (DoxX/SURF4 family)
MFYASLVLGALLAFVFIGASRSKITKSLDDLAAAGQGWVKQTTLPVVRLVGVLELLGGIGVVAGPLAGVLLGWTWATALGLAAAAGLGLTMTVAAIMHIARGEFKYTWKMNLGLVALAVADVVVIAFI